MLVAVRPPTVACKDAILSRCALRPPLAHRTADAQQPACVAWVEHPIYFLNDKYDSSNLWHGLEDVTHAFEAFVLKGWGPEAQARCSGVTPV